MSLIALADVKTYAGISGTTMDSQITQLINGVETEVKKKCHRDFESSERTEYYDGDGSDTIIVKEYPITAISGIWDDTDRDYGSDTKIDSDDIIYGERNGVTPGIIVLDNDVFSIGVKNIKITYTAGYVTDGDNENIPDDLKQALYKLVYAEMLEIKGTIFAVSGDGDGQTADRPGRLRKQAWAVLNQYKTRYLS